MARAAWLSLLAFVGCAPLPRAEFHSSATQCAQVYSGEQAQECVAEAVAATARYNPGRAFDELTAFIAFEETYHPPFRPIAELAGLRTSVGAAVQSEVAELYAEGKVGPAQHRAELLCAAWHSEEVCPFRKELGRMHAAAVAEHQQAAAQLSKAWPLASLLHLCLADPSADACGDAASAVGGNLPGVALQIDVDKSCRAVIDEIGENQLVAQVAPEGGAQLGRFRLVITGCEATKPSETVRSERCYFDPQSQRRDGRSYPAEGQQEGSEVATVATTTRGFRIQATLHVGEGNLVSRKAGLVDGSRHSLDVDRAVIAKQTRTSAHCKLDEVTTGEPAAARQALAGAIHDLTLRLIGVTMPRDVATVELFWADASVNKRTAEAEHWAVMSYLLQRKDFPETGGAHWLVERHGWRVGRDGLHPNDFPALSRTR